MQALRCWAAIAVLSVPCSVSADEFYVDPESGSAAGDGSRAQPWQTWEAVVKAGLVGMTIHAGDTVWLRSGRHGASALKGGMYDPPIKLAAEEGQTPQLSAASFAQTRGWVVRGLSISPSFGSGKASTIVSVDKSSADITVRDCKLFSVEDASGWDAKSWIDAASSGIQVSGDHVIVSHNQVSNVRFGISVDGPNALIEYNSVVNFSADGLRGLGDNGVFQYNLVKNVYVSQEDGDDNHDDGFQSWSTGPDGPGSGVVKGVVLRGNTIINREDPNQNLSNSLQGIGCFDGFFEDWVVENNVVATDHWHGISFYGMRGGRIVNNTVVDINDVSPGPPWIMVNAHKDGTKSDHVLIRNNLATDYSIDGDALVQDHDTTLKDLATVFVDPGKLDLHLKAGAAAIDQASSESAPTFDADGIARPQGAGVDLGAYEWHSADVKPSEAGTGGSSSPPTAAGRGGASGSTTAPSAGDEASGGAGAAAPSAGGAGDETPAAGARSRGSDGCGCRLTPSRAEPPLCLLLAALGLILRRGRRRHRSAER